MPCTLCLPREAQTSHRARGARRRSWHRLLKSVRHDHVLSFGTQHDRASLARSANFILAHRRLCGVRCGIARHKVRLAYPASAYCVRSILTSRRLSTHATDRAPRSAISRRFLSVHFALTYRVAFDTRCSTVKRDLALSFNTQAGAFYSGRRIAATFYAR